MRQGSVEDLLKLTFYSLASQFTDNPTQKLCEAVCESAQIVLDYEGQPPKQILEEVDSDLVERWYESLFVHRGHIDPAGRTYWTCLDVHALMEMSDQMADYDLTFADGDDQTEFGTESGRTTELFFALDTEYFQVYVDHDTEALYARPSPTALKQS